MYYFEIFEAFYLKNIKYLVVGGLAVNLHGVPRVTQDIEIIISMDKDNIVKVIEILEDLSYIPRLPVNPYDLSNPVIREKWIKEKNLKAFSFYNKKEIYKVVDIILTHPLNFEQSYQSRIIKKLKTIEVNLISIKDLITMKKMTGRDQDLSDIELLKKVIELMEDDRD